MWAGLACLPSLESLAFRDRAPGSYGELDSTHRQVGCPLAGPATLRTLVWVAQGWDWGDVALMQRLSAALPSLTSLDMSDESVFRPQHARANPDQPARHLHGCFPNLTDLQLPAVDRECWALVLAHLPVLHSVGMTRVGGPWGRQGDADEPGWWAVPALPHVRQLTVEHLDDGDLPEVLEYMVRALPQLQRLHVGTAGVLVPPRGDDDAASDDEDDAAVCLAQGQAVQALNAMLARYGNKPAYLVVNNYGAEWVDAPPNPRAATLSIFVARWPELPLIYALDGSSLPATDDYRPHAEAGRMTPAAELAARLTRCLPRLQVLNLGLIPADKDGHGNDGGYLTRALLELALGLPWSLRFLNAKLCGSGLDRAQLQGLLQGLADAGRRNLVMLLEVGATAAPAAASQAAAAGHAGPQELHVCLKRAGLEVLQSGTMPMAMASSSPYY